MICKECNRMYNKDLFNDNKEIVCICGKDNHYIGYPDETGVECILIDKTMVSNAV